VVQGGKGEERDGKAAVGEDWGKVGKRGKGSGGSSPCVAFSLE